MRAGWELPAPARAGRVVCRWPGNLCFWCGARSCTRLRGGDRDGKDQDCSLRVCRAELSFSITQGRVGTARRDGGSPRAVMGASAGVADEELL